MTLTTDELLLGGTADAHRRDPGGRAAAEGGRATRPPRSCSRPLVLADVQRIHQAAHESRDLTSVLMVQQALVEPTVTSTTSTACTRGSSSSCCTR